MTEAATGTTWGRYVDADGDVHFRYCAALRLSHPTQDPAAWTRALDLEPDTLDVVGEPRIRGKRVLGPAKCSFWVHSLVVDAPSGDIDDFLARVTERLADKGPFLEKLVDGGGSAELFLGYFLERSNTGFELPAKLLRQLADLHLDLSFDIYDYDAEEEASPAPTQPLPNPPLPTQGRE